jgi:LysR family transcriptional regulator, glycine cleavage system transcriptional activator
VSHQIRALEEFLDTVLFLRNAGHIELTHSGLNYYSELTLIFDRLDQSTQKARDTNRKGLLSVRATPLFASRWLLPRMKRFNSDYPGIELEVTTTDSPMQFPASGVDILIQYGTCSAHGLRVEPFLTTTRHPVCSPEFLARNPVLAKPEGLTEVTLLRDMVGDEWKAWFQYTGCRVPGRFAGPRFAHCELTMRAAEESQGVALGYKALVKDQIAQGVLVRLFETETPPQTVYSFTCLESSSNLPRVSAFKNWAFKELQANNNYQHKAST